MKLIDWNRKNGAAEISPGKRYPNLTLISDIFKVNRSKNLLYHSYLGSVSEI